MDIMEFLETNYVWIIVVAVILIMTVIGFIADKHDFGKKEKKNKEKTVKNTVEPVQEENIVTENFDQNFNGFAMESNPLDSFEMPVEPTNEFENNFASSVEEVKEEPNFLETQEENQNEDLYTSFGDMDNSFVEETSVEQENSNGGIVNEEQPVEMFPKMETTVEPVQESVLTEELPEEQLYETIEEEPKETLEMELPSIDTLNEEIAEVQEDEDVWKF